MTTNYTEELLKLLRRAIADLGGSPPDPSVPANLDDYLLANLRALLERLPTLINPELDPDLAAIAQQGTTAYGRSLLLLADVLALRSAIGLGALAYLGSVPQGFIDDNAVLGNNLADGIVSSSKLAFGAVTLNKMQAIAHQRLLGNNSGAAAVPSEISFSTTGLSLLQAADAAAARSVIGAVDDTHQNQTVGPNLHGLGADVWVLGNRNAAGEFIQRGTASGSPPAGAFTISHFSDLSVTFPAAFSSPPLVFVNGTGGLLGQALNVTTTGFTMRIFHATSGSPSVSGRYLAIGS